MAIVNEIYLSWDEVTGAESYNIYKSTDGVTYSLLASGVTDLFYSDPVGTIDDWYKIVCVDAYSIEGEPGDPIQGYDPADTCLIRGSIVNPDGTPAEGEPVEIVYYVDSGWDTRETDLPRFAQDNLLTRKHVHVYTDYRGIFEANVVKLALVMFTVRQCGYQVKLQVPDEDLLEIKDLASYGTMYKMEYPF
jgi:hypothetical protein